MSAGTLVVPNGHGPVGEWSVRSSHMTTWDFNSRLVLGLVISMIVGLLVLFFTGDASDAAHAVRSIDVYLPLPHGF